MHGFFSILDFLKIKISFLDFTFENLQKWTPVALSLGDRVFFAKFTLPETSKCSGEALRGTCRPATGRQVPLSPGGRATGPLPTIKCVCPPGRSFGARNFQKKERGVGKVKRRSPAGFLACDL